MLKRDLESVKRELRNLKTGQHMNKKDNAAGEMTMAHERTEHATYDPRCEKCVSKCAECQRNRER